MQHRYTRDKEMTPNLNISPTRFPAEEKIEIGGGGDVKEIMTDILVEINMEKFTCIDIEHTIYIGAICIRIEK